MVERRFKAAYPQRVAMSKKLGSIKPIIALVHEFAGYVIDEGNNVLLYINKIQKELYDNGVLPFEVKNIADRYKIDELPFGDVRDFLNYIWLAYMRLEEDWYWDEKLQQYVARNAFWSRKAE